MSENGGLLSVTTTEVVDLPPSEGKRLCDGVDRSCSTVGDVKELCHAAAGHEQLDGETNGCNGLESCDNCYTDSGISNSADMDICSMELLDDSETHGESYGVSEENQTICATREEETFNDICIKDTRISNLPNNVCSESKTNGDGTAETVLSHDPDPSGAKCTIYDGNCNIDTSAECHSRDIDVCDTNNDEVLCTNAVDDCVQSSQHSVESTGNDNTLDIKVDDSTCCHDVSEFSFSRADEDIESCPNSAGVTSTEVENLPADKSSHEGNAVETSEIAVFTSVATSELQSQPIFTSSRSVPRPSRQSHPRMGSYGSPPTSATPSSSCPDDDTSKQQYVVNVLVNPGETFSVCVSDQVQLIQGPATVRMVSSNGPPLPMPMQVPPGHMVQQIIDENGILTNVILSSQPPGIMAPPLMVGYYGGPNGAPMGHVFPPFAAGGGSPYAPYTPQPAPPASSQYPLHPAAPPPPPHQVAAGPPPPRHPSHGHHPITGQPPSQQQQQQPLPRVPHLDTQSPGMIQHCSPPHSVSSTHSLQVDGRPPPLRAKGRLQRRLCKPHKQSYGRPNHFVMMPPPRRNIPLMNGVDGNVRRCEPHSESSSSEDQELEEERRIVREQLSKLPTPKISDVDERSALIVLSPPHFSRPDIDVDPAEFQYELFLSENRDCKFSLVYSGDATEITLRDLKPSTDYHLKVLCLLDDLRGDVTDPVSFRTPSCEPDAPSPPKLHARTVNSITLKWNHAVENGSKITSYSLECDQGHGNSTYVEVYSGLRCQFKLSKLTPSTSYWFRLAAVNSHGKSDFSSPVMYTTAVAAPSQPDPPMLSEQFVSALTVSWIRRPGDDVFMLHMDDESKGVGFVRLYKGSELSYTVSSLHHNREYKFRLQASNEDGTSPWSDVVQYRTLCDRPRPPSKPQTKGKLYPDSFRVIWDPPRDTGGIEVSHYLLQVDSGAGFEQRYSGTGREYVVENLQPGHTYGVRVAGVAADQQSEWSEVLTVDTQVVPPGICRPVCLLSRAQATCLHIGWGVPDYCGGATSVKYELLMTYPDTEVVYHGKDTSCRIHGLQPGRAYRFQVRALNDAGEGLWSDAVDISTRPNVPDAPTVPTVVCKSPHIAQISWSAPAGNGAVILEYRLEWQQKDVDFTLLYSGLSLTAEVSGLMPASTYSFRVQAVNEAGAGPCSQAALCVTPPSCPAVMSHVQLSSTATTVHVSWSAPPDNGSPVTAYYVCVDERPPVVVDGGLLEYVISDLHPETTYRVRMQAANAIGHGAFCLPVKVVTKSLPPQPPCIECVVIGSSSLKLKWRDSRYIDLTQYILEMQRSDGSFQCIYRGSGHSYKVVKLTELTQYAFRICASNEAGFGPYSDVYYFTTSKASPPAIKAPRVSYITIDTCRVDWNPLKPMGDDAIVYIVQLSVGQTGSYRQVYRGPVCNYHLTGLQPDTEYSVRVYGMRITGCSGDEVVGIPSVDAVFKTLLLRPVNSHNNGMMSSSRTGSTGTSDGGLLLSRWTDQQCAVMLLLVFALCALLTAFLAQQVVVYSTGVADDVDASVYDPPSRANVRHDDVH